MISKSTIDAVYDAVRVEEVIGDFVQLKRSGSNFKGLSPFSNERTPSFMVSPVKQIWKDFSSGKGGNAIAFIMEHEHFTYPEAIRYLAKKYNIEIEEIETNDEEKAAADVRESMYLVSEFAQKFFHDQLLNSEEGRAIGLSYFRERGFSLDTIKKFGLGFSPEGYDVFSKEALGKGYKLEFLESTGLTISREDRGVVDRFRARVMFPIHSMSGRVVGFGGRTLSSDKKIAKYLNSPESDIYHKSKALYGIYQARQAIAKRDACYLVEGYTDVIQFHQSGIENVVASSGTALTPDQIRLINRLTKNITVLFDGDAAGVRASLRGIDLILEEGLNVKVCSFPDGDDPDSFARKNSPEELQRYLDTQSTDFIRFKASLLMDEAQNDPVKKAGLIRDIVTSISKIPDRIQREVYVQECSKIMDISEKVLVDTLAQLLSKSTLDAIKNPQKAQKAFEVHRNEPEPRAEIDVLYELERRIIQILLLYGSKTEIFDDILLRTNEEGEVEEYVEKREYKVFQRIYLSLQEDEVELANPLFRGIYQDLITCYNERENFTLEDYLQRIPQEYDREVADLLLSEEKENLHNWEVRDIYVKSKEATIAQYVSETILSLRWFLVHRLVDELKNQVGTEEGADNTEILATVVDYHRLMNNLSGKLGRVMSRY